MYLATRLGSVQVYMVTVINRGKTCSRIRITRILNKIIIW